MVCGIRICPLRRSAAVIRWVALGVPRLVGDDRSDGFVFGVDLLLVFATIRGMRAPPTPCAFLTR